MKPRVFIWGLAGLFLIWGLSRLRFDVEVLNLLPPDIPVVQGLRWQQEHFANARELIITLKAPQADVTEEAARSLALELRGKKELVQRAVWQPPWQEAPLEAAELMAYLWLNADTNTVQQLVTRLQPGTLETQLQQVREELATSFSPEFIARRSYDPLNLLQDPSHSGEGGGLNSAQLFASEDGTFRLIHVDPAQSLRNYQASSQWLTQIRSLIENWQHASPVGAKVTVRLTGGPVFMSEIAGGMERDMRKSVIGTLLLIGILFYLAHRRLKPLLLLVLLLGGTVVITMAFGGFIFSRLNVISLGFAAILVGLAVDYALVLYQEGIAARGRTSSEVKREVGPGIWWSAITTAAAFLALNFSGLPGLAQLGTLVGGGILIGAAMMLHFFPRVLPVSAAATIENEGTPKPQSRQAPVTILLITGGVLLLALVVLKNGLPGIIAGSEPLRPRHSEAYATMDYLKHELGRQSEPLMVIVTGDDDRQVAQRLAEVSTKLEATRKAGKAREAIVPTSLWPDPAHLEKNRITLSALAGETDRIQKTLLAAGFSADSFHVAQTMFQYWKEQREGWRLPESNAAQWIMQQMMVHKPGENLALGIVTPASDSPEDNAALSEQLGAEGVYVAGWELLGKALLQRVEEDFFWVVMPCALLVLGSLWLAFKRWSEVLLSLGTLCFSGLLMLVCMRLLGWSWNLMNLMAIPLLLGAAVDYSIHLQLALRRHAGSWPGTWQSTGKALLLCASSTVIGFGSLAFSENSGLASMGQVCSLGVCCAAVSSLILLPGWWNWLAGPLPQQEINAPSTLYRANWWQAGLWLGRNLPQGLVSAAARLGAHAYGVFKPERREILVQNLLPLHDQNDSNASRAAGRLLGNFGQKLVDLWRYESGVDVTGLFGEWTGWEHFEKAQQSGKGILLVTPHLGNWEFGGPLLTRRGVKLLVLTLAEPGDGFTEMRQQSRERWGIETLVVRQDAFAFVEVIKRLQEGATVALLMDRPPIGTGVEVELFGQPFQASISAGELARATGCVVLPTVIVRAGERYAAHILPAVEYERAGLGSREARKAFTQQILRAFEPLLRQYSDQWYHFVSIWPSRRG